MLAQAFFSVLLVLSSLSAASLALKQARGHRHVPSLRGAGDGIGSHARDPSDTSMSSLLIQEDVHEPRRQGESKSLQISSRLLQSKPLRGLLKREIKPAPQEPPWPQVQALRTIQERVVSVRNNSGYPWGMPPGSTGLKPVCSWDGVTCEGVSGGDVVNLTLANTGNFPLWGRPGAPTGAFEDGTTSYQSIPPSIGALTSLTSLDLSNNALLTSETSKGEFTSNMMRGFTGSIPSEIVGLKNLKVLRLQRNSFSGTLPEDIGRLTALEELRLDFNLLSGPIPTTLCNLTGLISLSLSYNNFTGPIPPCISSLARLSDFSLISLPLSGSIPSSVGEMTNLTSITLTNVPYLSGPFPTFLSTLSRLLTLNVLITNVSGALPEGQWWRNLFSLDTLYLSNSPLSGSLPQYMPSTLTTLQLINLPFSGGLPEPLIRSLCNSSGSAPGLRSLNIENTPLGGPFPELFSSCVNLEFIRLENTSFTGGVPRDFFNLMRKKLFYFDVTSNRLDQWGPSEDVLETMPELSNLRIGDNLFRGTPPTLLCSQKGLFVDFNISMNRFSGDIRQVLGKKNGSCATYVDASSNNFTGFLPLNWAEGAQKLNLSHNRLSGVLPPIIPTQCTARPDPREHLKFIDLSNNSFTGPVPSSLFSSCSSLATLDLSRNALDGALPNVTKLQAPYSLVSIRLSHNRLTGHIPPSLSRIAGLSILDLSNNSLYGGIPLELPSLFLLSSLNLSSNHLSLSIPPSLALLSRLTLLSLSHNSLSGDIPRTLAPPYLPALLSLDLSNNNLSGPIPWGFENLTLNVEIDLSSNNLSGRVPGNASNPLVSQPSSVANNPFLCGGAGYPDCPESSSPEGLSAGAEAGIVVGCLAFAGLIAGLAYWFFLRETDDWEKGVLLTFHDFDPPLTIRDLLEGSGHFGEDHFLGAGGFGSVYKATLPDGSRVAIKRLSGVSSQGNEEFKAEVEIMGRLSHRNVVRLFAAYIAAPPRVERLLVYDFLPGGSLDQVLQVSMPEDSPFRDPELRYQLALDVSKGLRYLHHYCDPGIIHRDIKPANVLLSADLVGVVADFGLAKDLDLRETHVSVSVVVGTAGFVAPEYISLQRTSFKSDVYAFGVTLIQLITGRRTTDNDVLDKGLQRWASSGSGILDPNLEFEDEEQQNKMLACLKIGLVCISRVACDRPTMEEVVQMLENYNKLIDVI